MRVEAVALVIDLLLGYICQLNLVLESILLGSEALKLNDVSTVVNGELQIRSTPIVHRFIAYIADDAKLQTPTDESAVRNLFGISPQVVKNSAQEYA